MSDRHRLLMAQNLLKEAARLYEKHEAGRPEPFNVFSVLHSESDEVNLHSHFLHALLDYQKPEQEIRENLADFLQHVGIKDFEQSTVKVERERDNIDILITNDDKKEAVAIENKIKAVDQPKQLLRYHDELKRRVYCKKHLLYLTLDGHSPSEDSVDLDCKIISYRDDLPQIRTRSSPESASRAAASRPDYPVHRCSIYSPSRWICPVAGGGGPARRQTGVSQRGQAGFQEVARRIPPTSPSGRHPRERGRPARMLSLGLPLSFPAMLQPTALPAGTAWARPKQRQGAAAG